MLARDAGWGRRAGDDDHSPRLSSAFSTMSKLRNHDTSNWGSLMLPCMGVILTFGLNAEAVLAATWSAGQYDGGWI